ncbi:MAG: hypothetical protein C4291_15575 [Candidatus Dadabacteria bacterium]
MIIPHFGEGVANTELLREANTERFLTDAERKFLESALARDDHRPALNSLCQPRPGVVYACDAYRVHALHTEDGSPVRGVGRVEDYPSEVIDELLKKSRQRASEAKGVAILHEGELKTFLAMLGAVLKLFPRNGLPWVELSVDGGNALKLFVHTLEDSHDAELSVAIRGSAGHVVAKGSAVVRLKEKAGPPKTGPERS